MIFGNVRFTEFDYTEDERRKMAEWFKETNQKSDLVIEKFKQMFPNRPVPIRSTIHEAWYALYKKYGVADEAAEEPGTSRKRRKIDVKKSKESCDSLSETIKNFNASASNGTTNDEKISAENASIEDEVESFKIENEIEKGKLL